MASTIPRHFPTPAVSQPADTPRSSIQVCIPSYPTVRVGAIFSAAIFCPMGWMGGCGGGSSQRALFPPPSGKCDHRQTRCGASLVQRGPAVRTSRFGGPRFGGVQELRSGLRLGLRKLDSAVSETCVQERGSVASETSACNCILDFGSASGARFGGERDPCSRSGVVWEGSGATFSAERDPRS